MILKRESIWVQKGEDLGLKGRRFGCKKGVNLDIKGSKLGYINA